MDVSCSHSLRWRGLASPGTPAAVEWCAGGRRQGKDAPREDRLGAGSMIPIVQGVSP
jgi:hypothetical protein